MKRLSVAAAAAAAYALGSRTAAAEPVQLRYAVDAACPSASAFESLVGARTALARFDPAAPRTFDVVVERRGDTWAGTLRVATGEARASVRYIEGDSCDETAGALALVAALAIDPNASAAPVVPVSTPPPKATLPGLVSSGGSVVSSGGSLASVELHASPPRRRTFPLRFGGDAEVSTALAPAPLTGGAIFGEIAAGDAVGSPSLRVSLAFASSTPFDGASPSARYTLGVARVAVCPLGFAFRFSLGVHACAALGAGVAHAAGVAISHPSDANVPWVETTVTAALRWESGRPVPRSRRRSPRADHPPHVRLPDAARRRARGPRPRRRREPRRGRALLMINLRPSTHPREAARCAAGRT